MNAFSLIEQLSVLHDPRQSWKVDHKLSDILLLTICAVIAGAEGQGKRTKALGIIGLTPY